MKPLLIFALAAAAVSPAHATLDLLVSDPSTQSVRRYDGQTGAYKGNFVASGSGHGGFLHGMKVSGR